MDSKVNERTKAVEAMQPAIDLVRALLGGTVAMRAEGQRFLPMWPNEEEKAYAMRIRTSVLFPAYSRTVMTLTGKPFSKPVTINDDVPRRIKAWLDDIDLQGRNIDVFSAELLETALSYGIAGVLIDYPTAEGVKTQEDEARAGLRPYWVMIYPWQVLGWKASRRGGVWVIDQLRIKESVEEDDGEFSVKSVSQIRVLEPGKWRTFRKGARDEWVLFADGVTSLNFVPYVPVYGKRTGFMTGEPPLLELAHLNIKHWQSQSDQDNLLHVCRVPILTAVGVDPQTFEFTVGASSAVKLPIGGKLEYVEHSGSAIGAGSDSLEKLKEEMRQSGAELLVLAPGQITATQVMSENAVGMCALQRMVLDLEDALDLALQYTAAWVKEATGGSVTLFNDFGAASLAEASAQLLLSANVAGKISDKTFFHEMQRRGILSSDVEYDEERERIESQGPPRGELGLPEEKPEEEATEEEAPGEQQAEG